MKHITHYLPLLGIFFAGVLAFKIFYYDQQFLVGVAVSLAASYVVWGVVHHHIHDDLSLEVLVEYVSVALLGLVAVLSVIYRS